MAHYCCSLIPIVPGVCHRRKGEFPKEYLQPAAHFSQKIISYYLSADKEYKQSYFLCPFPWPLPG